MAVYVHDGRHRFSRYMTGLMLADSLDELHAMADRISVPRGWFRSRWLPHYDLPHAMLKRAVAAGARPVAWEDMFAVVRRLRRVYGARR